MAIRARGWHSMPMIAALLLLAQAAPPSAPPSPPPLPPATLVAEPVALAIAGFDVDGDARVTRAEVEGGVRRSFAGVANGAETLGYIVFADWAERYLGNRSALPSPFETDANGDDRISLAELQAKFAEVFARMDVDKDGVLTRAELLTIRADAGRGPDDGRKRKKK